MKIELEGLVPFQKAVGDMDSVLELVEELGKVIFIKDNRPAYILTRWEKDEAQTPEEPSYSETYTLHQAMKIVLLDAKDNTLHASELADIIHRKKLYFKRDGSKAEYNQMRARAGNYTDMFEALPGNYIRLKTS